MLRNVIYRKSQLYCEVNSNLCIIAVKKLFFNCFIGFYSLLLHPFFIIVGNDNKFQFSE